MVLNLLKMYTLITIGILDIDFPWQMRKSLITVNYHKCYTAVLEKLKFIQLETEFLDFHETWRCITVLIRAQQGTLSRPSSYFMLSSTLHPHLQNGLLPAAIPVAYSTYSELPSMPRDTFPIRILHNVISGDPCNNGLLLQRYKKKSTLKNQNFCTNSICVPYFIILLWLNYDYYWWLTVLRSGNYLHLWRSIVQYSLHNSTSLDTILSKKICLRFCLSFHNTVGYIFCGEGLLAPPKPQPGGLPLDHLSMLLI